MNINQTVFKLQTDHKHILQSFLIALSFTGDLEIKHTKAIVSGFVQNEVFYVSNQKFRGYLEEKDSCLTLTPKAKILIQYLPIEILANINTGDVKIEHEVLLVRTLFLCLLHLNFNDIKQIRKQKQIESSSLIPDLTIVTEKYTFYIEVHTKNQPFKNVQAKIEAYKAIGKAASVIYFSDFHETALRLLQHPLVQVIHLRSEIISQDIEKLTSRASLEKNSETAKKLCKGNGELLYEEINFSIAQDYLADDWDKRREEAIKLLY